MLKRRLGKINFVLVGIVALVIVVGASILAIPSLREAVGIKWGTEAAAAETRDKGLSAKVIFARDGAPGLNLTQEAISGLQIEPVAARRPATTRALPAQSGTINYDIDRLFSIPARVSGEIAEMAEVEEPALSGKPTKRPIRAFDRVKQGQLLAVVFSPTIGQQKGALVDALCSLQLSEEQLERHLKLYAESALSFTQLKASERQVQADRNSVNTAERTLRLWKMNDKEIDEIKKEAKDILEKPAQRNPEQEAKRWGRVEVRVPVFDPDHMDRELTIVEKNTNLTSMVDPINTSTPLFRVADMSRLQIWAHPPEEYLPLVRQMLEHPEKGPARWDVRFQAEAADKPPLQLTFFQVAPSLDPAQHTPMVVGYIDNPKGSQYVAGQFVTVTLYVAPEPDTVEVPTDALNEVNGESLVFVQSKTSKYDFIQRRVVVVARFKDWSFVRSKLTDKEKEQSQQEVARKRLPLAPLHEGDRLVTRGILEMTACLEDLQAQEANKK
jgi:multidrug efflux pump subunit AcrA (membrane-fusion protein)